MSSSAETTSYDGNCHCGAVRYTVTTQSLDVQKVARCNCSICTKNGYLLIYPKHRDVVFHQGYDELKSYQFGNKNCEHKFCPTCGSSVLIGFQSDEHDMVPLNVRLFKGIEVDKLHYNDVDGWNKMGPPYNV
ncbi:MAG: hypothetical protein M1830_002909 [Pleopsidium flavum]|nr:MAG: hypothetical protein M1830_002909 [Pleopsidium flavum]